MLTPQQEQAALSPSGSLCVIAGAGAGKTRVIAHRVKHLVDNGSSPGSIAVITFSKRAADEIKSRLIELDPKLSGCLVGTFHAVAYELMPYKPMVLDQDAADKALRECFQATGTSEKLMKLATEYRIGLALNTENPGSMPAVDVYLSRLAVAGEADYLSLLTWFMQNVESFYLSHILVDEAQDNEPLQWEIVKRFTDQFTALTCVMDPRQMIYGWRGADSKPAQELTSATAILTDNFRNPKDVVALANLIANDIDSTLPKLTSIKDYDGLTVTSKTPAESVKTAIDEGYQPEDIAVLCRSNATVQAVTQELELAGYPVAKQVKVERKLAPLLQYLSNPAIEPPGLSEIQEEILSPHFLSSCCDEPLVVRAMRIAIWMRDNGETTRDILDGIDFLDDQFENEIAFWNNYLGSYNLSSALSRAALYSEEPEVTSGIRVMTIHQSKGLEFPVVIAAQERYMTKEVKEEEVRLLYVLVTRASERLVILDTLPAPGYLQKLARNLLLGNLLQSRSVCTLNHKEGTEDGIASRQENPECFAPVDPRRVQDTRSELCCCG